jgi:processive 1,2-diacylglycerol beta-glucosyltransferase
MEGRLTQMRRAQRILVLTLSFGSGHVQAAQTVAEELRCQAPRADVLVVDALARCRFLFRAIYVWPYWAMVRYAPSRWDRFFRRRVARVDQRTAPEWAFQWGCPQVFEAIAEFNPNTIVATEVAACEMAVIARREGLTRAQILSVITDYEAEPVWVKAEVETYTVADPHVRSQLCSWGAPEESIVTCGIPTARAFQLRRQAKATKSRYGINDDAPIVLIMGGGNGPTRMDEVAAKLCESHKPMHVIAVAGRDARALRRLQHVRAEPPVSLHVLGWTEDIASVMQAASVLVTKPGGLTTAEAAMCALPLVMFDPIPGPEQRNAERLVQEGAGLLTNNAQEAVLSVLRLLRNPPTLRRMSARAEQLARPDAAAKIARLALDRNLSRHNFARRMTA